MQSRHIFYKNEIREVGEPRTSPFLFRKVFLYTLDQLLRTLQETFLMFKPDAIPDWPKYSLIVHCFESFKKLIKLKQYDQSLSHKFSNC